MPFYIWDQNNSGGSFVCDDTVAHRVIIEADTYDEAEEKAFSFGIYYDGVESDFDCPCCGDRWYRGDAIEATDDTETVEDYAQCLADASYGWTTPSIYIHYKDGRVHPVFTKGGNDE